MRHVRQRNDLDCGIAAAAITAECSYGKALKADPSPEAERGFSVREMLTCLKTLTQSEWIETRRGYNKPLITHPLPMDKSCIILIRPHRKVFGHWIVWGNNRVYDPQYLHPLNLSAYVRKSWEIVRILLPTS